MSLTPNQLLGDYKEINQGIIIELLYLHLLIYRFNLLPIIVQTYHLVQWLNGLMIKKQVTGLNSHLGEIFYFCILT